MALADHPTQVHTGAGVVAHLSGAIVVALPDSAEHRETTRRVIEVTREASDGGGVSIVRRLAGVLGETDPQDAPPLAVVADAGDGGDVAILLHGGIDLTVHHGGTAERLSGSNVPTWVDRVFPAGWDRLEVTAADAAAPPFDPLVDLREGTVGGGGVTVVANATAPPVVPPAATPGADETRAPLPQATAPEPPPPPAPTAEAPPPQREFISVSLDEPDPEPPPAAAPLPVATADVPAAPVADDPDAPPTVLGVHCSRGHFNDPNVLFCNVCGISMAQLTANAVEGPRPALGVLVLDDGTTFLVDRDYVIGREPDQDPAVQAGTARPLPLADTQRTLSRVHAKVLLDGWTVTVTDAGSANGTYIADSKAQQWTRIGEHSPVQIKPGTHLLVGHRTFVFETHRGSG